MAEIQHFLIVKVGKASNDLQFDIKLLRAIETLVYISVKKKSETSVGGCVHACIARVRNNYILLLIFVFAI